MRYFIRNEEVSENVWNAFQEIFAQNNKYQEILTLIATPVRSDGTWNRDRKTCFELAKKVLEN